MVLDALTEVELFIHVFVVVYILAVLAYILTSWINLPYSLRGAQRFLYDVCEPYLRLWRRLPEKLIDSGKPVRGHTAGHLRNGGGGQTGIAGVRKDAEVGGSRLLARL